MPLPAAQRAMSRRLRQQEEALASLQAEAMIQRVQEELEAAERAQQQAVPAGRLHTVEERYARTNLPERRDRLEDELRRAAEESKFSPLDGGGYSDSDDDEAAAAEEGGDYASQRSARRREAEDDAAAVPATALRAFETDTEAGKLLRRLYGSKGRPEVNPSGPTLSHSDNCFLEYISYIFIETKCASFMNGKLSNPCSFHAKFIGRAR